MEYFHENGKQVSEKLYERIRKIRLPPNLKNVQISADSQSGLQATGIDAAGRTQYIYNSEHKNKAEKEKFLRMQRFINQLPKFHERINKDLELNDLSKNNIIAVMFKLMSELNIRAGNRKYLKNKSYGLSTLQQKHAKITGSEIRLRFRGKSGIKHDLKYNNPQIAKILSQLLEAPIDEKKKYKHLFRYKDNKNNPDSLKFIDVNSADLNTYLKDTMGKIFISKDFRTYSANYNFLTEIVKESQRHKPKTKKQIKKNLRTAIERSAKKLGHQKSISKKAYIMTYIQNLYMDYPELFRKPKSISGLLKKLLKMYTLTFKKK